MCEQEEAQLLRRHLLGWRGPPQSGGGKRFKPEKGTCVTEEDPVCDDPDHTVLDKTLKKCVLKSGPDCPTGQRYNPATRSCVLLLGDCLEFEFCPIIISSVPAL